MVLWEPKYKEIVQGRKFARKIEADMYCRSETRADWAKIGHDCQLKNIFASKKKLRMVNGYIEHENTRRAQEIGTCTIVFDEWEIMVDSMDVDKKILDAVF